MKKFTGLLALAILTSLLASGCATLTKGPQQRVEITSEPHGARVLENGRTIGLTPMTASLSRKRGHELTLEKPGYYLETVVLHTVPNDAADAEIRFGLDEMTGAQNDLEPSEVHVALDPLLLPESDEPVEDPVSELTQKVLEADELLYANEIDAEEHRYILSRLLEFYQR